MDIQNTRAVSLLDLTGFPVRLERFQRLLIASFTPMEKMTLVLDLVVQSGGNHIAAEWIKVLSKTHTKLKQAAADITGPLQFRPMVYTLYIGINLTIIMKQYGDRQTDTNI